MRSFLLTVHIAAAGTWLGANVTQAVASRAMGAHGSQAVAGWYRFAGNLSRFVYIPAGVLLVITGTWMVLTIDAYSFGNAFVIIGLAVVIVGAILGSAVFDPTSKVAAQAAETNDASTFRAAAAKLATFGVLDTLLILLAITVMVLRLGA